MPQDISVHATPVWDDLARVAPLYAGDPRLAVEPRPPRPLSGWPVGLEHKLIALALPELRPPPVILNDSVAAAFRYEDQASNHHLLARPPGEIAAWRLWRLMEEGPLSASAVSELARLLGGESGIGGHSMVTDRSVSGHRFLFTAAAEVPARLERLLARLDDVAPPLPPLLHAAGIYFETLLVHPLRDGNGRLARLFFQGALRRTVGLEAPLYPLGPAKALHRGHLLRCYLAWQRDRDPRPLLGFILDAAPATRDAVAKLL